MYPYPQQQPYSTYSPQQSSGSAPPPPPGGFGEQMPSYPPPPPGENYPYQQHRPPAFPQHQDGPGQYPPHGDNPYGNYPSPHYGGPYGKQTPPPHQQHYSGGGSPYVNLPPPPGGSPYANVPPPAYPGGAQAAYGQQPSPYGGYGQQPAYGSTTNYSQPLHLTIQSANNLINVEKFGKQDPYVQFSTSYQDVHSFQKTAVANNAGKSASWNQSFSLPAGAQTLYIEVMDKERAGFDEVIGFAAIPLQQANMGLNAVFEIYSAGGKSVAGEVHLTFGQSMQQHGLSRGQSYVDEGHAKRVKSLKNKATASDVAVGGALALGAGLLAKRFYDEREQHERREEYGYGRYRRD